MDDNEIYVIELLKRKFNITLCKIPETEDSRSPDFKGYRGKELILHAELKTIVPSSAPTGWFVVTHKDGSKSAIPDVNALSRLAYKIHKSYGQLILFPQPRVLILLNDDPNVDLGHLEGVYTGYELHTDGKNEIISPCYDYGFSKRIDNEKSVVDLYLWIDRHNGNAIYLKTTNQVGEDLADNAFDISHNNSHENR